MRTLARENVYKYLFARLFNPSDEGLFAVLCKELNEEDKSFAQKLLDCVLDGENEYLSKISKLSVGYKLERVYAADKCSLLIGMAELDKFDTPIAVAIDEAVKLSAKYSTENSTDFVNGILSEFAKKVRQ